MFKIGQKVICINDTPIPGQPIRPGIAIPKKDKIYTVRDVYQTKMDGYWAILVEEIKNPPSPVWGKELGFRAIRFREIDDSYKFAEGVLQRVEQEIDEIKELHEHVLKRKRKAKQVSQVA